MQYLTSQKYNQLIIRYFIGGGKFEFPPHDNTLVIKNLQT